MPVAGLLDRFRGEAELGNQVADFGERESGVEGIGKELPLVIVAVGRIRRDELVKVFGRVGAQEIAEE
jgi:hypothetical protein